MTTETESRSRAVIETEAASRYLQQLCKHFAHKVPVQFDEAAGEIRFDIGTCHLRAEAGTLVLEAEAVQPETRATLEDVVARHLIRFAFRDDLKVIWQPI